MRYYIYRHGYNDENQPKREGVTYSMRVAELEADDAEEALELAHERVIVYPNQTLTAELADEVDRRGGEIARSAGIP
ncbi:hypothetical protein [Tautonia marina]|uniref:hypothetical protein n=1 Tax=Tautonia marina TaxID=2653855 RepID=UPI0012606CFF|nr:hypothetical protein [Tautonia marina]